MYALYVKVFFLHLPSKKHQPNTADHLTSLLSLRSTGHPLIFCAPLPSDTNKRPEWNSTPVLIGADFMV